MSNLDYFSPASAGYTVSSRRIRLSVNTAALYTRIQSPGAVQVWATGQSYAKDVQVTHNDKTWISMVDNNVWEPGVDGVFDNIWKEV